MYTRQKLERARQPERQLTLADIPADAPYEDEDADMHVWDEEQGCWIGFDRWRRDMTMKQFRPPIPEDAG